jgi:hypothetical protein
MTRVTAFADVLDAARARMRDGREIASECRGPVPEIEMGVREAKLALCAAGVSVAAIVFVFVAYGVVFWIVTAVAAALWYAVKRGLAGKKRLRATWRRDAVVVPAALVMANDRLFAPGDDPCLPGCVVVSFDARFERNPEALAEIALRAFALKSAAPGSVPEVEAVRENLASEVPLFRRIRIDERWAGAADVWLVSVRFHRSELPSGHVDRRIWPCVAHPVLLEEATAIVPAAAWWSPDADGVMAPL